jgi:menaquinone-dependent protoporphyrinogen oxidase
MRVLVSAASKHGGTEGIVEAIGEALDRAGIEPVILEPSAVVTLEGIDAAVIGSAVYAGRWLEPARDLLARHADELRRRPVWLFSSGPLGDPPLPPGEPADGAAMREFVDAREDHVFAGRLDRDELGMGERLMVRVVRAPSGDFRSWPEIGTWAAGIASTLLETPAPA